jgi:hypothetical protein
LSWPATAIICHWKSVDDSPDDDHDSELMREQY